MPFTTDLPTIYSNLTNFSAQLDVQTLDPSNLDGGSGSVTLSGVASGQPQRLRNKHFTVTDDIAGSFKARVSDISIDSGTVTISAETMLNRLAVDVTVPPRQSALDVGMSAVLALVGMSAEGLPSTTVVFPGWTGSLLDYLKHFCAAFDLEFVPHSTNVNLITFRAIRGVTSNVQYITETLTVNSQSIAKSINITNYNYAVIPGGDLSMEFTPQTVDDMQVLTVDSGETITYDIQLNAWASLVNQPVVMDLIGPEVRTDVGAYCVSGADGLPITAAQWTGLGGSLLVEITEDPSVLRVTVSAPDARALFGPDGDEHLAPYSIAATSGDGVYYNSLHITGTGIRFRKEEFSIPTGLPASITSQEREITVNNPWVNNLDLTYKMGVRAAQAYSGSNYSVEASTNVVGLMTTLLGSRLSGEEAWLRIVSVTTTPGVQSFSALLDTTMDDFDAVHAGRTFSQLNAILGSVTFDEWATVPLKEVSG